MERLLISRHGYRFEGGADSPTRFDCSEKIARHPVGDHYVVWAGAPGVGRTVYLVTRVDEGGAWGVVLSDTVRELTPAEVV